MQPTAASVTAPQLSRAHGCAIPTLACAIPTRLQSFGAYSCPFTARDYKFYFALVLPWWTLLIFGGIILLDASMRTLPLYSLAVQMGSDFKHRE